MQSIGGFVRPDDTLTQVDIPQGVSVADFGCGAGYFSIPIAQRVGAEGNVYAIDVLASALETVASQARRLGMFNIHTIRADLERPGGSTLPDAGMDLVFAANILHQALKREVIFGEAYRILKPRGQLVIIEWEPSRAGIGPPLSMRLSADEAQRLAHAQHFKLRQTLLVDEYHYGLLFKK